MEKAAVSLAWLQQFVKEYEVSGKKMTPAGIVKEIILPATAERRCSYADMMLDGPDDLREHVSQGRPFYYVIHSWSRPLSETLKMLTCHFGKSQQRLWRRSEDDSRALSYLDDKTTFLWIDIFAVNQHNIVISQDDDDDDDNRPLLLGKLRDVVQNATCALMVLDAKGSILTRLWCLYEAWLAGTSGREKLRLLSYGIILTDGLQKMFSDIDFRRAVTTLTADRENLLSSISTGGNGGFDAVNMELRQALFRAAILQVVHLQQCGEAEVDCWQEAAYGAYDDEFMQEDQNVASVNIAGILLQLYGSLVQASLVPELLWNTLEDCQMSLGPYHPNTMRSFVVVADFMHYLGRHDVAQQLLEHVVKNMERILGPSHPDKKAVDGRIAQVQLAVQEQKRIARGANADDGAVHKMLPRLAMLMQQQPGAANDGNNRQQQQSADEDSFLGRLLRDSEDVLMGSPQEANPTSGSSSVGSFPPRQLSPWRIGKGVNLVDKYTARLDAYQEGVTFANFSAGEDGGGSFCYFEISIPKEFHGDLLQLALGFAPISHPASRQVGLEAGSYGLYNDNGIVYLGNESASIYYGDFKFRAGDVMGAALDLERREIFFTKNGRAGNPVRDLAVSSSLCPAISLESYGAQVSVNFGQSAFAFDVQEYQQQQALKAKLGEMQQSSPAVETFEASVEISEAAAAGSLCLLGTEVNREENHISMAAISLAWLRRFIEDNHVTLRRMTSNDIIQELILPHTAACQCRYTDMMMEDPKQAHHVSRGRRFYFVSHVWSRPFAETFEMLDHHFRPRMRLGEHDEPMPSEDEVFLWLDLFAVNQHNTRGQADNQDGDLLHLDEAVQDAVETLMVLDREGTPLTRIWCLFEAWTAGQKGPGKLRLLSYGILFEDLEKILTKLDVKGARAGKTEDKERILKAIQSQKGGLARMTRELKEALVGSAAAQVPDVGDLWTAEMDSTRDSMRRVFVRTGQDKYIQAEQLYEQTLRACQQVLGHGHPATLRSFGNLAAVLARQGQYERAETYYRLALEGWTRVLGLDFAFTQKSRRSLLSVLSRQEKLYTVEEPTLFSDNEIFDGQVNNRVVSCTTFQTVENGKKPYLTMPLEVEPGYRVEKIGVEVVSHDQGWSDYCRDHGTYNNSWTWGELVLLDPTGHPVHNDGNPERLYTNLHAIGDWQTQTIVLGPTHPLVRDINAILCQRPTAATSAAAAAAAVPSSAVVGSVPQGPYSLQLLICAAFPGWSNHVREARIELCVNEAAYVDI
ncbi:hypothetical protein Vretifemale_12537 [Volvox reticuliferus]|uniref:B30.2/SPRY domain-containing protein n=1 Tax=Volvox reticuliferus TaxID=1737510 RepID=A0A8J4FPM9_9CHLO|nr:hypothetical protein Vretifemale_12537 [Volvox reticuliferus]